MELLGESANLLKQMEFISESLTVKDANIRSTHELYVRNYRKLFGFLMNLYRDLCQIEERIDKLSQIKSGKNEELLFHLKKDSNISESIRPSREVMNNQTLNDLSKTKNKIVGQENISENEILKSNYGASFQNILTKILKFVESVENISTSAQSRRGSQILSSETLLNNQNQGRKSSFEIAPMLTEGISKWEKIDNLSSQKEDEFSGLLEKIKKFCEDYISGEMEQKLVFDRIFDEVVNQKPRSELKKKLNPNISELFQFKSKDVQNQVHKEDVKSNLSQNREQPTKLSKAKRPNSMGDDLSLILPNFFIPLKDQNVPIGIEAKPEPQIHWFKDGEFPASDSNLGWVESYNRSTGQCTLFVEAVTENHGGQYICRARNPLGCEKTFANLTIETAAEKKIEMQANSNTSGDLLEQIALLDFDLDKNQNSAGIGQNPAYLSVYWFRRNSHKNPGEIPDRILDFQTGRCIVKFSSCNSVNAGADEGGSECTEGNERQERGKSAPPSEGFEKFGEKVKKTSLSGDFENISWAYGEKGKIFIQVTEPEVLTFVTKLDKQKIAFCGDTVKFEFAVEGKPEVVHWYFNQMLVFVSPHQNIAFENGQGHLELREVNQRHSGIYQVVIKNEKQTINSICKLIIKGRQKSISSDTEVEYDI